MINLVREEVVKGNKAETQFYAKLKWGIKIRFTYDFKKDTPVAYVILFNSITLGPIPLEPLYIFFVDMIKKMLEKK